MGQGLGHSDRQDAGGEVGAHLVRLDVAGQERAVLEPAGTARAAAPPAPVLFLDDLAGDDQLPVHQLHVDPVPADAVKLDVNLAGVIGLGYVGQRRPHILKPV